MALRWAWLAAIATMGCHHFRVDDPLVPTPVGDTLILPIRGELELSGSVATTMGVVNAAEEGQPHHLAHTLFGARVRVTTEDWLALGVDGFLGFPSLSEPLRTDGVTPDKGGVGGFGPNLAFFVRGDSLTFAVAGSFQLMVSSRGTADQVVFLYRVSPGVTYEVNDSVRLFGGVSFQNAPANGSDEHGIKLTGGSFGGVVNAGVSLMLTEAFFTNASYFLPLGFNRTFNDQVQWGGLQVEFGVAL
ncbi:MAG: outer membrane beta-barrel protein [Myxococcota bacterium]